MGLRQDLYDPRLFNPKIAGGLKLGFNPAVSATGGNQAAAQEIHSGITLVNDANGSRGVRLAASADNEVFVIRNLVATTGATLAVYPPTGGIINALATNGAFTVALGSGVMIAHYGGNQFYTIPL